MEQLILLIVFGFIMIIVASVKGFNPLRWFFAAGLLGLIILFFLPSASAKDIDENEKLKRAERGNKVGTIISIIALILTAILIIAGIIISGDSDEILPVLLFSLLPLSAIAIGIFILFKLKKIKPEFGSIAGYVILALIICVLINIIQLSLMDYFFPGGASTINFDSWVEIYIAFALIETIFTTYLIGLFLWRKKIRERKSEINPA